MKNILSVLSVFALLSGLATQLNAAGVKANVKVIIDKLPIEKEQKMENFHLIVKEYIESVEWLEPDDDLPLEVSLQLFLTESPSNIEDRYNCEFLISSTDVQYFDRRVRFPYQPGDVLIYSNQSVHPLTGVLNFYMNMILGSELDKYRTEGGNLYYKRAQDFAALGKFVRTEFIRGSTERDELIKRVNVEPFPTFRKMKDYYFYGIYLLEEEGDEKRARKSVIQALDLLAEVVEQAKSDMEEHNQFLNAHYNEIIDLFKDYSQRDKVFRKLVKIDPDHADLYEKHIEGS